jgi:hypothetical protein
MSTMHDEYLDGNLTNLTHKAMMSMATSRQRGNGALNPPTTRRLWRWPLKLTP